LHRRLRTSSSSAIVLLLFAAIASQAASRIAIRGLNAPADPIVSHTGTAASQSGDGVGPESPLVKLLFAVYQRGAGPTKGTRCPMTPSCSEYSRLAVARHGLVLGIVMTADRLHRCGHDLAFYEKLWSPSQGWYYEDPPR